MLVGTGDVSLIAISGFAQAYELTGPTADKSDRWRGPHGTHDVRRRAMS